MICSPRFVPFRSSTGVYSAPVAGLELSDWRCASSWLLGHVPWPCDTGAAGGWARNKKPLGCTRPGHDTDGTQLIKAPLRKRWGWAAGNRPAFSGVGLAPEGQVVVDFCAQTGIEDIRSSAGDNHILAQ